MKLIHARRGRNARLAPPAPRRAANRLACAACAIALVSGLVPLPAFAADEGLADPSKSGIADQFRTIATEGAARYIITGDASLISGADDDGTASTANALRSGSDLPEKFDLRERGVVTPVKLQNPWGSCWGFASIAASETSILSELGTTYDQMPLDLSERHLAWFAVTPRPENEFDSQAGEGLIATDNEGSNRMNSGGVPLLATMLFSSGIGPVLESDVPYRNNAGIVDEKDDGHWSWAVDGGWEVSEDLRSVQTYELEESVMLPPLCSIEYDGQIDLTDPDSYDPDKSEYVPNYEAWDLVKEELLAGRAVTIGFHADTSLPGQGEIGEYLNTDTWAHYTYETAGLNHAVTVVGWDDSYPKENFLEGKQPPEDGAWLVKNSWGAGSEESPNWGDWGVDEDDDGVGDGYFWLSYYDMGLTFQPETFDFNVEEPGASYYHVAQYDFMPTVDIASTESSTPARMANVFVAEEPQMLRALSVNTAQRGVAVSMEVRLLDEDDLPGEGELVATCERTFEQAGYHRVDLDAPVMLDGGQRYAVVVEQKAPDGTWRVTANSATNKLGAETFVEWGVDAPYYVKGVVNRGESYLYDEAAGGWSDWRDVLDAMAADPDEAFNAMLFDYDNFSIKAYSDPVMATDADLAELREAMDEGKALLASAQQSVDGSDVAKDAFWVPEAEYLLLEGAIAGAQDALALEDPTLGEIDLAHESLQLAMDTFAAAKKPGLKEAEEQKPPAGTETDAGKGDGTASDESNADDSGDAAAPLAGTGDGGGLVSVGIVAAAGAGALALAARRVRNDEGREIS